MTFILGLIAGVAISAVLIIGGVLYILNSDHREQKNY